MGQQTVTQDALLLGTMQGKGKLGTEIYAGVRAELTSSPLNVALSSLGGRMAGRVLVSIIRGKSMINYQKHRIDILAAAVERAIPPGKEKVTLVDAPCGFSPLGMTLAQRYPHAAVLEMDLKELIRDKHTRLQRGRNIVIPPNLHFIEADFRTTPIHQILATHGYPKIDTISFLAPVFTLDELMRVSGYLRSILTEQGAVICFGPWKPASQIEADATRLLRRQAQFEWRGVFHDREHAIALFAQAGFSRVDTYLPSELRPDLAATNGLVDVELFVVARC
jgi:hypothetical protein